MPFSCLSPVFSQIKFKFILSENTVIIIRFCFIYLFVYLSLINTSRQCSNQYVPPIKMDLCNTKSFKKGDIQPAILQTAENADVIEILKKEGFTCSRNVCTPCKKGTYGDGKHGCINCPAGNMLLFVSIFE